MDGIINIYKEAGFTSHDVVAKLRKILHQKKIGHTGTLDPEAIGVLPICCGKATKVCELLTDKDKTYQAVCKLGITTDTQDATGEIIEEKSIKDLEKEQIEEVVYSFLGESEQIPPMYSALKVNGKKLYELAREGVTVERKSRPIKITNIDIKDIDVNEGIISFEITCSKGTYIRTICNDIGEKLGCGGIMQNLVRTRVSVFAIEDALTLSEVERLYNENQDEFYSNVISVDSLFPDYPRAKIKDEYKNKLYNGNILEEKQLEINDSQHYIEDDEKVLIYDENNKFKAIYKKHDKIYSVVKMF